MSEGLETHQALVYMTTVDNGECVILPESALAKLETREKAINDFCSKCVFKTVLALRGQPRKMRCMMLQRLLHVDDSKLDGRLYGQLKRQEDRIFDNTLICDKVWFVDEESHQVLTRYNIKTVERDEQGDHRHLCPDAEKLLELTRAWHIHNFPRRQVEYH